MLWRRCSNVEATSWQRWRATLSQRRKLTSVELSFSTVPQLCDNVNNDVVTTLSQRRCASWAKFSINVFFRRCDQIRSSPVSWGLVTFIQEILNEKLIFCAVNLAWLAFERKKSKTSKIAKTCVSVNVS